MSDKKPGSFTLFVRNHQRWLGFLAVTLLLLYVYFSVLFEPKHIVLDIVYGILFVFMTYGIYHAYLVEKAGIRQIRLWSFENLFLIAAVFLTFATVHFFGISMVLASSFMGLVGHFCFRKYEVAIYTGSFAGMVSVALFGFFEVAVLALVCVIVFQIIKPVFNGYGGKLGTIAFLSSLIVHSIFFDEFLVVEAQFQWFLLLGTTILGVLIAYLLHQRLHLSIVLASASASFVFALIVIYLVPAYANYAVVFFASSFIGTSSKEHLPNLFFVILSGIILGLVMVAFETFFNGLGGKLGLMAFISIVITSGISKLFHAHPHAFQ